MTLTQGMELKFGTWNGLIFLNIFKYGKLSHKSRDMPKVIFKSKIQPLIIYNCNFKTVGQSF